jgi:hypothetical protein
LFRDYFVNWVFRSLKVVALQDENGLAVMQTNKETLRRLTNWNWINVILNAN